MTALRVLLWGAALSLVLAAATGLGWFLADGRGALGSAALGWLVTSGLLVVGLAPIAWLTGRASQGLLFAAFTVFVAQFLILGPALADSGLRARVHAHAFAATALAAVVGWLAGLSYAVLTARTTTIVTPPPATPAGEPDGRTPRVPQA